MKPIDASEPQVLGPASSARTEPAAGRGQGHFRIQCQPDAFAVPDGRAAGRRSSGADIAGFPRQRSVDGADAAISKELGYDAYAWNNGRNVGGVMRMRSALRDRLAAVHTAAGRKVSIIGWSLGGVYARDLALQAPDMVRSVITLGSPFANDIRATNATRLYEALSGEAVEDNAELETALGRRFAGSGRRRSIRAPTAS
jgi:pimeloyl-ACP methyl ester carboxylesterase